MNAEWSKRLLAWGLFCFVCAGTCAWCYLRFDPHAPKSSPAPVAQNQLISSLPSALTADERRLNLDAFEQVWKTVRDKHWDPKLNGLNWQSIHDEIKPKVEQAQSTAAARVIVSEMLGRLGQSHLTVIPAEVYAAQGESSEAVRGTTGIDLRIVSGQTLVVRVEEGSPAARRGVKPGWEVLQINGRELAPFLAEIDRRSAENPIREVEKYFAVMRGVMGPVGSAVSIVFRDGGDAQREVKLALVKPRGTPIKFGNMPSSVVQWDARMLDNNIVYIRFDEFQAPLSIMPKLEQTVRTHLDAKGFIIDLRGNLGGLTAMIPGIANWFVRAPNQKLGSHYSRAGVTHDLIHPRPETYDGPLAILVDGCSASSSEVLAAGLQDLKRAKIIGARTAGAVLTSIVEKLPNGDGFQFPVANYISVGGRVLEGKGVQPDVEVVPDRVGLLTGGDPILAAAVRWLTRPPLAEDILNHRTAVTGGLAAYGRLRTIRSQWSVESVGSGIKGTMTIFRAAPDKLYRQYVIPDMGTFEDGCAGARAWERSSITGPRLLAGEECTDQLRDAIFDDTTRWHEVYPHAECVGEVRLSGGPAYKVVLRATERETLTAYFDQRTGLEVKSAGTYKKPHGEGSAETTIDDYCWVQGIRVPHRIRRKSEFSESVYTLKKIDFNVVLPANRFEPPEDVRSLMERKEEATRASSPR